MWRRVGLLLNLRRRFEVQESIWRYYHSDARPSRLSFLRYYYSDTRRSRPLP